MKLSRKISYCIFMSFLIIMACTKKEHDVAIINQFTDIKAMGDTCPTAAIQRLDSMSNIIADKSEYIKNKYDLLNIRLRDKAYITHTTDSVIKKVCRYFEKTGTAKEKQEAYYYMGSVYRDMHDSPNAVTYFLKAIALGEDYKDIDSLLLLNSYSQLSGIYIKQFNDSLAIETAEKELNLAKKVNIENAMTYMKMGNCIFQLKDTFNTIRLYRLALEDIIERNKERENLDIISKQMGFYTKINYKAEADYCYALLKRYIKNKIPYNYPVNLAIYYNRYVSQDSAKAVLHRLYKRNDVESKYDASRRLTKIYANEKDYKNATFYALEFIAANTAVIEQLRIEHTTNARNFFQYNKDKEEEIKIKQKSQNSKIILMISIFISILIILLILLLFYHRKNTLLDIILKKENDINSINNLIEKRASELEKLRKELKIKEKEIHDRENEILQLNTRIQKSEENIKALLEQNNELTKMTLMKEISSNAEDIIEKFIMAANGKYILNDEDWKDLFGAVNNMYPEFLDEIQDKFKRIKEPMLRVCYLMKIGLTNPQITNITNVPPQTAWYRIKTINDKMGDSFQINR